MDVQTLLRQTVAEFFQIAPEQVAADLDFRGRMSGSVARARFDAALRNRLKIVCPQVYSARTYGELEAAILGGKGQGGEAMRDQGTDERSGIRDEGSGGEIPNPSSLIPHPSSLVACGIDLESPEQFPLEADYWESEFYRANFSRAEIAYCMAQADPRQHFAARWCAKESLKKCDAQYVSLEMNRIEVVLDGAGRPSLHRRSADGDGSVRLPVAVSLTHLGALAAAVVVKVEAAKPPARVLPPAITAAPKTSQAGSVVPAHKSWWRRLFG
jgi:holo-[acyl-carrier protein] synthase